MSSMQNKNLVNAKNAILLANKYQFAIPHININNLEWIHASIDAAIQANCPIILGVSMGAAKYMGGYKLVYNMVNDYMNYTDCSVEVILHLDHGNYESCLEAINSGFSSVMFDGSSLPFKENIEKCKILSELCNKQNISLEVEVGSIGGEEDGINSDGELADINQCIEISKLQIDFLAAGIGNIHGLYPQNWKGLNFGLLQEIASKTMKPIVLHGGSGIDDKQIIESIRLGIRKINVNTECQIAFSEALKNYFETTNNILDKKAYDPRKYLKIGKQAIINVCLEKFKLFNCFDVYNKDA